MNFKKLSVIAMMLVAAFVAQGAMADVCPVPGATAGKTWTDGDYTYTNWYKDGMLVATTWHYSAGVGLVK